MQRPLEIRFRQMEPSPAVEARIREKAAVLERLPRGRRAREREGWQATTLRLIGKHHLQPEQPYHEVPLPFDVATRPEGRR